MQMHGGSLEMIYTPTVLGKLGERLAISRSRTLERRLEVLTARGPYPHDRAARLRLRRLRAERAALEAYLDAARSTGVLDDDMIARLRSSKDEDYRAAVAEAITCWILAGKMGMEVRPRPLGRDGRVLDQLALHSSGELHVEVKAPYVEKLTAWSGNDAPVLVRCLRKAHEKFETGRVNLAVLVPDLRTPIANERSQMLEAFIGQPVMRFQVDTRTGAAVGPTRSEFLPDGHFVRGRTKSFTRVSAVVSIEPVYEDKPHPPRYSHEQVDAAWRRGDGSLALDVFIDDLKSQYKDDHEVWVEHRIFVCHNPFAEVSLDESVFEGHPQLVRRGDVMEWTDGYRGP